MAPTSPTSEAAMALFEQRVSSPTAQGKTKSGAKLASFGLSPSLMAQSLAIGLSVGLCPLVIPGLRGRLLLESTQRLGLSVPVSQVGLQMGNRLAPLTMIPLIRAGEGLFGLHSLGLPVQAFGSWLTGLALRLPLAVLAWTVALPVAFVVVYLILLPLCTVLGTYAQAIRVQRKVKEKLRSGSQSSGIRMLQRSVGLRLKGELGEAVREWRRSVQLRREWDLLRRRVRQLENDLAANETTYKQNMAEMAQLQEQAFETAQQRVRQLENDLVVNETTYKQNMAEMAQLQEQAFEKTQQRVRQLEAKHGMQGNEGLERRIKQLEKELESKKQSYKQNMAEMAQLQEQALAKALETAKVHEKTKSLGMANLEKTKTLGMANLESSRLLKETEQKMVLSSKNMSAKMLNQGMVHQHVLHAFKAYAMAVNSWKMKMLEAFALEMLEARASSMEENHAQVSEGLKKLQKRGQEGAVRQLRQILARMVRGELGMRLVIWRLISRQELDAFHTDVSSGLKDLEHASKSKQDAVRQMRHILVAMARGELGMRVVIWRLRACRGLVEARTATVSVGLSALAEKGQRSVIRQLQHILTRMTRGELGLRVMLWRRTVKAKLVAQAALLEALHRLRHILARMMGGELGMRLSMWRLTARHGVSSQLNSMVFLGQKELEARHKTLEKNHAQASEGLKKLQKRGRGGAVRQLRQILARMVRGELGMRLVIWRFATRHDLGKNAVKLSLRLKEQTHASKSKQDAVRRMRHVLARTSEAHRSLRLAARLVIWRLHGLRENKSMFSFPGLNLLTDGLEQVSNIDLESLSPLHGRTKE